MISDILFQYHSTSASNTLTVADLAFQADDGGDSMVTLLAILRFSGFTTVDRKRHQPQPIASSWPERPTAPAL